MRILLKKLFDSRNLFYLKECVIKWLNKPAKYFNFLHFAQLNYSFSKRLIKVQQSMLYYIAVFFKVNQQASGHVMKDRLKL
ncbi:hypothetical protein BpHYR1_044572 [Brachionus plicatilis]|uniref:Uncharacterized protein n=1 Tax=Brachionus plicatilis TaxID=10195 RepID=A0A3M7R267_BRAPC|nr:hypothetical protein BpHYR1_044572 [Brachionus plicatilis]